MQCHAHHKRKVSNQGAPVLPLALSIYTAGVNIVPVIMGLFGISEILTNLENKDEEVFTAKVGPLAPTREEWRRSIGPIGREQALVFSSVSFPDLGR